MKTTLALQLFASAALADQVLDLNEKEDKDIWAHQTLVQRLGQCSSVKIQNVGTGTFLTQSELWGVPACQSVTIKKEGTTHGLEDEEQGIAHVGQTFNLIPSADRTVRIESSGSALGLHANRRDTNVGCSLVSEDPYTTQPLHTSANWAIFRTNEIKPEDNLNPDDLLDSEWYIMAYFTKEPLARLTKYDENFPETASRVLTAKSSDSDAVEALLVLEDIKSLEDLRELAKEFSAHSEQKPLDKFNTWKFTCGDTVIQ